ncbi:MAG TPA: DNA polymerase III subunit delta' C-terminal domain-containing protein [Lamprocystis sp. (in: g-proteobacteria)]|nr:DNA polymerase III subunit delta' C-terminal domain-containing protein [Lamprocystis sp. (in: g-proteobacteria)]
MTDPSEPVPDSEPLPWLAPLWARLMQARAADRLPHAILLVGPRGLGKRRLADLLVRALLCTDLGPQGLPCGRCADCQLTTAGSHPNLLRVVPDPESKSGEITIDAIRYLTERATLTTLRGARKLMIIDPADRMTGPAANALLKTLEEPTGDTLLCLIAEQPSRLPATIRSRCQLLNIPIPPVDQALAWLTPRLGDAAVVRLRLAAGAPLRALEELDQAALDQRETLVRSLIGIGRSELDPVGEAAAWNGVGARLSLEYLAACLCDLLRLAVTPDPPRLTDPGLRAGLGDLAVRIDPALAHRLLRRVFEARGLTETTVNPLLQMESLLIDWGRVSQR